MAQDWTQIQAGSPEYNDTLIEQLTRKIQEATEKSQRGISERMGARGALGSSPEAYLLGQSNKDAGQQSADAIKQVMLDAALRNREERLQKEQQTWVTGERTGAEAWQSGESALERQIRETLQKNQFAQEDTTTKNYYETYAPNFLKEQKQATIDINDANKPKWWEQLLGTAGQVGAAYLAPKIPGWNQANTAALGALTKEQRAYLNRYGLNASDMGW